MPLVGYRQFPTAARTTTNIPTRSISYAPFPTATPTDTGTAPTPTPPKIVPISKPPEVSSDRYTGYVVMGTHYYGVTASGTMEKLNLATPGSRPDPRYQVWGPGINARDELGNISGVTSRTGLEISFGDAPSINYRSELFGTLSAGYGEHATIAAPTGRTKSEIMAFATARATQLKEQYFRGVPIGVPWSQLQRATEFPSISLLSWAIYKSQLPVIISTYGSGGGSQISSPSPASQSSGISLVDLQIATMTTPFKDSSGAINVNVPGAEFLENLLGYGYSQDRQGDAQLIESVQRQIDAIGSLFKPITEPVWDFLREETVIGSTYKAGMFVGLDIELTEMYKQSNIEVEQYEKKWAPMISKGVFTGTETQYAAAQEEYNKISATMNKIESMEMQKEGLRKDIFGTQQPTKAGLVTYPIVKATEDFTKGWSEGFEKYIGPVVKPFRESYIPPISPTVITPPQFAGIITTVGNLPGSFATFGGMVVGGGEVIVRHPEALPAAAVMGGYLQARSTWEGITTRPHEFIIENLGFIAAGEGIGLLGSKLSLSPRLTELKLIMKEPARWREIHATVNLYKDLWRIESPFKAEPKLSEVTNIGKYGEQVTRIIRETDHAVFGRTTELGQMPRELVEARGITGDIDLFTTSPTKFGQRAMYFLEEGFRKEGNLIVSKSTGEHALDLHAFPENYPIGKYLPGEEVIEYAPVSALPEKTSDLLFGKELVQEKLYVQSRRKLVSTLGFSEKSPQFGPFTYRLKDVVDAIRYGEYFKEQLGTREYGINLIGAAATRMRILRIERALNVLRGYFSQPEVLSKYLHGAELKEWFSKGDIDISLPRNLPELREIRFKPVKGKQYPLETMEPSVPISLPILRPSVVTVGSPLVDYLASDVSIPTSALSRVSPLSSYSSMVSDLSLFPSSLISSYPSRYEISSIFGYAERTEVSSVPSSITGRSISQSIIFRGEPSDYSRGFDYSIPPGRSTSLRSFNASILGISEVSRSSAAPKVSAPSKISKYPGYSLPSIPTTFITSFISRGTIPPFTPVIPPIVPPRYFPPVVPPRFIPIKRKIWIEEKKQQFPRVKFFAHRWWIRNPVPTIPYIFGTPNKAANVRLKEMKQPKLPKIKFPRVRLP